MQRAALRACSPAWFWSCFPAVHSLWKRLARGVALTAAPVSCLCSGLPHEPLVANEAYLEQLCESMGATGETP